jgi:tryptophanyl-tRNA synthetase
VVPVGADQLQHLEVARELARRMNATYGPRTVRVPEAQVSESSAEVPGIDGRKMSKSYGNHIPLAAPQKTLRKSIARFVTDSRRPKEPADPDTVPLFALARAFATPPQLAAVDDALRSGQGYASIKAMVFELVDQHVAPIRQRHAELMAEPKVIHDTLREGADRARGIATETLRRVKAAIGFDAQHP